VRALVSRGIEMHLVVARSTRAVRVPARVARDVSARDWDRARLRRASFRRSRITHRHRGGLRQQRSRERSLRRELDVPRPDDARGVLRCGESGIGGERRGQERRASMKGASIVALTRRFLSLCPRTRKNPVRDLRGGRKDLGARVVPAPAGNRGIGPDRRDRVPRYAW
jgi:hypothetical protein